MSDDREREARQYLADMICAETLRAAIEPHAQQRPEYMSEEDWTEILAMIERTAGRLDVPDEVAKAALAFLDARWDAR